jgi:hypothetical protein
MIKVPLWIRDLLKRDGSRTLTADWDIGNGRMIQTDKIRARDGDGLALYEDGGKGIFIKDGCTVGIETTDTGAKLDVAANGMDSLLLRNGDNKDGDGNDVQIAFGFDGSKNFKHWIRTRHNNELVGSAIDFYVNDGTEAGTFPANAVLGLSINGGNVGIRTLAAGNPLAVNRSADGTIVDFESADIVEGSVSIAGNTTSYNAFMGSHYTQLKAGQKTPPVGAIVIATGEIVHCEANIKVPVMEKYYEEENEIPIEEGIEDDIIEEQVGAGRKQTAYILIKGKVIKTKIPILETIQRVHGKKLKENCRLDKKTGKMYKKIDMVLKDGESPPENVTILERQKTKGEVPLTEIKTKEVSGIERKEYFSYIELASQKEDTRVYGVYHAKMSDDAKGQSFGEDDKPIHQIAALGLYKVRVTDTNGDVKAGDYIQSSIRAGEGERQEDDIFHNYTVAKSIIDVDWNEIGIDMQLGYKWQLIPATLHAG